MLLMLNATSKHRILKQRNAFVSGQLASSKKFSSVEMCSKLQHVDCRSAVLAWLGGRAVSSKSGYAERMALVGNDQLARRLRIGSRLAGLIDQLQVS